MIENNRYYWSHLKTKTATVRVSPKKSQKGIVFRVGNMIDLGNGRQIVTLDNIDYTGNYRIYNNSTNIAVPFSMGNFEFIYTSKQQPILQDTNSLLSNIYNDCNLEKIVIDVLSPNDILIFKQDNDTSNVKIVDVLRIVKKDDYSKNTTKRNIISNAL